MNNPLFCNICKKEYTSSSTLKKHLSSKMHLKNTSKQNPSQEQFTNIVMENNVKRSISKNKLNFLKDPPVYEIKNTNTKIRYLYHISDIHIRLIQRHDEFRDIFEKLYKNLRSHNKGLIVITGDIFHSKDIISAPSFNLCLDFLSELSKIMPTIIISGNHDINLKKLNQIDPLTPIQKLMKNVYYFKYTGIYNFENISFVVQSIFDMDFIKSNSVKTNKDYKIALYHGMVQGAKVDNGFELGFDLENKLFDGFDCTLLGDVHKKQLLNGNIAYAGSLLQQNFGETLDDHGYLIWDLVENKIESIDIKNKKGFVKFIVQENKIINQVPYLPEIGEYKYICTKSDSETVMNLHKELTKDVIVSTYNIQHMDSHKNIKIAGCMKDEFNEKIVDLDFQKDIITEYITKYEKDYPIEDILEINKTINKQVVIKESCRFKNWYITKIEFSDCFSYKGYNVIDLSTIEQNSIIGIIGENGMGKSAIIDVIMCCLFKKGVRQQNSVINYNSNKCFIKLTLIADGNTYIIEKTFGKEKKKDKYNITYGINFYKVSDDSNKYIIKGGTSAHITTLEEYIGTYEQFILGNCITQNCDYFINNTAEALKKKFVGQLDFSYFQQLSTIANDEKLIYFDKVKAHSKLLTELFKKINPEFKVKGKSKLFPIDEKINFKKIIDPLLKNKLEMINTLKQKINNCKILKDELVNNINEIKNKIEDGDFKSLSEQLKKLKSDKNIIINSQNKIKSDIESLQKYIDKHFDKQNLYSDNILKRQKKIGKLQKEYKNNISWDSSDGNDESLSLELNIINEKLNKCGSSGNVDPNIKNLVKVIKDAPKINNDKYKIFISKLNECVQNLIGDNKFICEKQILLEKIETYNQYKRNIEIEKEIENLESLIEESSIKIDKFKSNSEKIKLLFSQNENQTLKLNEIENQINVFEKNIENLNYNKQYLEKIKQFKENIENTNQKEEEYVNELETITTHYVKLQEYNDDFDKYHKEYCEYSRLKDLYGKYKDLMSEKGIQLYYFRDFIPKFEDMINKYLDLVPQFDIKIMIDISSSDKVEINIIKENGDLIPANILCGSETALLEVCIKLAIINISQVNTCKLMIFDECFASFDSNNLQNCQDLYQTVKQCCLYTFMISHHPLVKSEMEYYAEIKKNTELGGSMINFS